MPARFTAASRTSARPLRTRRGRRLGLAFLAAPCALAAAGAAAEDAFELHPVPVQGRAVAAEIADLDGDGRADLLLASFAELPPDELRELHVFFQRPDGRLPEEPSWRGPLPADAAVYDLADLDGAPGVELLLLGSDRVRVLSLSGRRAAWREHRLPEPPSFAVAADERGLDRMQLVWEELGPAPRLLVPGLGSYQLLGATGEPAGRLAVGARANYFVPPRGGPMISESSIEIYLDAPRLASGDVDGDGRADLVTSSRHELRVFRQREGGRFPERADLRLPLRLLSEDDHVRSAGSVRVGLGDLDRDGRADLLVSHSSGGLLAARSRTALHRNRGGRWDLGKPDQVFEAEGGSVTHQLLDLDGDGGPELVQVRIPLGVLDLVEFLLTREIDAELAIFRAAPGGDGGPFETEPWFRRSLGVGVSFQSMRTEGFVPTLDLDLNGDGHRDLLSSGDGRALEVYLGGPRERFRSRRARQELDTSGRLRSGDYDGDGLPDLLLYDPRLPGAPLRLLVNRAVLPETPPVAPITRSAGP